MALSSSSVGSQNTCTWCKQPSPKLLKCPCLPFFSYCSKECQKSDWQKRHKFVHHAIVKGPKEEGQKGKCWGCGIESTIKCVECHFASYCSKECEESDLPQHAGQECHAMLTIASTPTARISQEEGERDQQIFFKAVNDSRKVFKAPLPNGYFHPSHLAKEVYRQRVQQEVVARITPLCRNQLPKMFLEAGYKEGSIPRELGVSFEAVQRGVFNIVELDCYLNTALELN